jgi:hypothetical protein
VRRFNSQAHAASIHTSSPYAMGRIAFVVAISAASSVSLRRASAALVVVGDTWLLHHLRPIDYAVGAGLKARRRRTVRARPRVLARVDPGFGWQQLVIPAVVPFDV